MEQVKNITAAKAALRSRMISMRRSLSESAYTTMSNAVAGFVLGLPEIISAHHINLYLPIRSHTEVATDAILDGLSAMHKQLSVPVIRDGMLHAAAFCKGDPVLPATYGQPEPEHVVIIDETELDVILLPLLAFDPQGYRLGFGKGFYDLFLHRLSQKGIYPCRIGLAYSFQMVDSVPLDPWDQPLDLVVNEQGILSFT